MKPYQRLLAFVDWNSQLLANGVVGTSDPKAKATYVLKRVGVRIAQVLSDQFPDERFVIDLRFYHGWHKGFEPTGNRKAIEQAVSELDFPALSTRKNVVYSGNTDYGDRLLSALPVRLHGRLAIHLPNTLRIQYKKRQPAEKMVDTALAADVVASAFRDPDIWVLVMTKDDDMVPPLYVAETMLVQTGARALLLRDDSRSGPFLKLDGILCEGRL